MQSFEVIAKSREAAIEEAIQRAGLPVEALDVVEKGTGDEPLKGNAVLDKIFRVSVKESFLVDKGRRFLETVLKGLEINGSVQGRLQGDLLTLNVRSNDNRTLIGRKGDVLEALQHLTMRAITRGNDFGIEVLVDVGGYWDKRKKKILERVTFAVQKVQKTRRKATLFPMNPQERKICHIAVKNYPGLKSFSEGKEGERYVVVTLDTDAQTGEKVKD